MTNPSISSPWKAPMGKMESVSKSLSSCLETWPVPGSPCSFIVHIASTSSNDNTRNSIHHDSLSKYMILHVVAMGSVQYDPLQALVNRIVEHKGCPSQTTIGKLVSHKQEVAPMDEESTKNTAKIALVVGITLFTMGLPLLIIGSISTAEDRLAMIIPGAILMCVGGFTLFMSVAAAIRGGSTEGRSSVIETGGSALTNNTTYLIKDEDLADEVNINEPFWEND